MPNPAPSQTQTVFYLQIVAMALPKKARKELEDAKDASTDVRNVGRATLFPEKDGYLITGEPVTISAVAYALFQLSQLPPKSVRTTLKG